MCEEGGEAQYQDALYDGETQPHIFLFHCQCAELFQIKKTEDKRAELSDDGGKGSAFHAPVEDEDKQRVQHTVEHSADQHGSHGIAGVAVGTDLIIDHNAHAGKHGAKKINAAVINGIGQHCVSGTKEAQQGNHEDFTDDTEDDSA